MNLPDEIKTLLPEGRHDAFAVLSCSPDGPVGETVLVAVGGSLRAFSRPTMFGDFSELKLDTASPPALERDDFSSTLHLAGADGMTFQLNVSSFERDNVTEVLKKTRTATPTAPAEPRASPTEPSIITARDVRKAYGIENSPIAETTPPDDRAPVEDKGPPQIPYPHIPVDHIKALSRHDQRRLETLSKRDTVYGTSFGLAGCLGVLIAFFSPPFAAWHGHEPLLLAISREAAQDSTILLVSKILLVVVGVFVGGRLAKIFVRFMQRNGKAGSIALKNWKLTVSGRNGAWAQTFDLGKPIAITVKPHFFSENTDRGVGDHITRQFHTVMTLRQDGAQAHITVHQAGKGPWLAYPGVTMEPLDDAKPPEPALQVEIAVLHWLLNHIHGRA